MNDDKVILEVKNVSKTFLNVKALDKVNFNVRAGEVMALAGENGAGKSTLMKIIAGVFQPDKNPETEINYFGEQVAFKTPLEAKKNGIVLVFQELSLVKKLSVAENIYLGSLPLKKNKSVDWKKLYADTKVVLEKLQCDVKPTEIVDNLPIAQQQMVEIARAIALEAKILILDEPTSSLTDKEKDLLFASIRRLKAQGAAIVYISHKMDEIFEISDRITVFRDGQKSGELITKDAVLDDIVELMIGRALEDYYNKTKIGDLGEDVLRVENINIPGQFEDVSFSLKKGEILGLYGLVGAGRTEIVEAIFGIRQIASGKVFINNKQVDISKSEQAVKNKLALVPENRKEDGLVLGMDCKWNIALGDLKQISRSSVVDKKRVLELFEEYKDKLSISTPGAEQQVKNLSGGNQQKVVIGKWLATNPEILMLDEPTRGIDVGSKAEIHKLIGDFAKAGMAVIMISSEMPEIIGVCSRVITIANGKISGEFSDEDITEANIMSGIILH